MVIFNHTFTDDKPIYFPDSWHTGKTQTQLHEEWKITFEGLFYGNILQIAAASMLIVLILAFASGAK